MNLSYFKLGLIVIGGFGMFGAWFAIQHFVSDPFLRARCASSCRQFSLQGRLDRGYVASKRAARCQCRARVGQGIVRQGYFFVRIRAVDWILVVGFRLGLIAILVFLSLFAIARLVGG